MTHQRMCLECSNSLSTSLELTLLCSALARLSVESPSRWKVVTIQDGGDIFNSATAYVSWWKVAMRELHELNIVVALKVYLWFLCQVYS